MQIQYFLQKNEILERGSYIVIESLDPVREL